MLGTAGQGDVFIASYLMLHVHERATTAYFTRKVNATTGTAESPLKVGTIVAVVSSTSEIGR